MTDQLKTRPEDQPLPTPGTECVQDALINLIEERKQLGIQRYGSPLMTHNGRDAGRDAVEEALDLTVYSMQVAMELRDLRATIARARAACDQLERAVVNADGRLLSAPDRGVGMAIDRVRCALDGPAAPEPSGPAVPEQHRFVIQPVDPELERAASDRARRAVTEARRASEQLAALDTPHTGLVVQPYRNDAGRPAWVFRCWGTDTCDGWLSLDHSSQQSAERARDRHLAEQHPAEPGPCPACQRSGQAGLAPAEQHPGCVQEQR